MLRLSRYFIRETTGLYIFGVAAFCLLLSIDMLTTWSKFLLEQEASAATVGRLMLYKLPMFLHLSMPIAIVFAILLATGRLAKDSELKAAYSLGVKPFNMLFPMLFFALLISLLTLLNNGFIEPVAQRSYDQLVDSFFYTKPPPETQTNVAYRISDDSIYFAGRIRADEFDSNIANLSGIYVLRPDGSSISAPEGNWNSEERSWLLYDAEIVQPDGSKEVRPELSLAFETASDAAEVLVDSASLTLAELNNRLAEAQRTGGQLRDLRHSFHTRIADAFSALIFALIASVLGLQLHGRASGFGWTIVLLVLFWALWTLSGQLFEQNVLSPVVAAWLTSGLVGVVGLGLAWWRLR
ncbi:MAG: LptF/LptG family permease [Trueperaceae bacterium]|nr:LptF/LptG family permease [Trueperaceae bacterium]